MIRRPLSILLALVTAVQPVLPAYAQSASEFTVRVPMAVVSFQPTTQSFNFGNVAVGSRPVRTFIFANKSTSALTLSGVTTHGAASVDANTCPATLSAGASCNISVALPVNSENPFIGEVRIQTNGATAPEILRVTATGTTQASAIEVTPSAVTFGEVAVGSSSAASTVTLKNVTGSAISLGDLYLAENTSYFGLTSACGQALSPGESCTVSVRFTPRLVGPTQSRLVRDTEDGVQLFMASFSGAGVRAEATWSVTQANFLDVPVGQKSPVQEIGLTNTGRGVLNIDRLSIVGDASFKLEGHNCSNKIEPSQSCIVRLSVTPPDNFVRSATLKLESSALELRSSSVQLYSRTQIAESILTVTPSALDFGDVQVNGTSSAQSIVLRSTGNTAVGVVNYSLAGTNASDFVIQNPSNCIGLLAPGSQCVLNIVGSPKSIGVKAANIKIVSSSSQPLSPIALSMRGVQGTLSVTPNPVVLGELDINTTRQVGVTVSNTGTAPVQISAINLTGPNSGLFSITGCANQTLSPAASCTATITYAPTTAGAHTANLNILNNGSTPSLGVPVQGSAKSLPPAGVLSPFSCPEIAPFGSTVTCSASLTNTGPVPLSVGTVSSSNGSVTVTNSCASSLLPGASCSITANVPTGSAPSSGTAIVSSNVSVATGAGALVRPVTVNVETSKLSLTVSNYPPVTAGNAASAQHIVRNTGRLPVTFTSAPQLTGQSIPNGFSLGANTCTGLLAPQATCEIQVSCAVPAGSSALQQAQLSLSGSNSASASGALSCQGIVPLTSGNLQITPNPFSYGVVSVNVGMTRPFTIENRNTAPVQISQIALEGVSAADYSIIGTPCASVPAISGATPGRCTVNVEFRPKAEGVKNVSLVVRSSTQNLQATASLTGVGGVSTVLATPNPVIFGARTVNSGAATTTVTVRNMGPSTVTLPNITQWTKTGSSDFSIANVSCSGATLAVNGTCTFRVTLLPASAGTKEGSVSITGSTFTPVAVAFTASVGVAPSPIAALGNLICTSPTPVNATSACSATLTNTGSAALSPGSGVFAVNQDPRTFGAQLPAGAARVSACTSAANLPVTSVASGQSCTLRFNAAIPRAGQNSVQLLQSTNGGVVYATAEVIGVAASALISTTNHAPTPLGGRTTAVHTLTNTGPVALALNTPPVTLQGPAAIQLSVLPTGSTACSSTLQPGQSCQIQTTCAPSTNTALETTLRLNAVGGNPVASGVVRCEVAAPGLTVALAGAQTTDAGAWSNSGNYFRATNTGTGPLTVSTLTAGGPNWQLVVNSRDPGHCTPGKVLPAGASCLFLSTMVNGAPGSNESVSHRVRMLSGNAPLEVLAKDGFKHHSIDIVPMTSFTGVQVGVSQEAIYSVVNQAPFELSSASISLTGSPALSVVSHTCQSGLKPVGQPGDKCSVTLRANFTSAQAANASLTVSGSYPQVINAVAQAPVRTAAQKSINIAVSAVAPRLTITPGVFNPVPVGQSASATSVVKNDGAGPVQILALATVTPSQFVVEPSASTCTQNLTLGPGQTCTISVRFTPVTTSAAATPAVLTQRATGVTATAALTGLRVLPGDLTVSVTDSRTAIIKGSSTVFVGTVRNQSSATVTASAVTTATALEGASITGRGPLTCATTPPGGRCNVTGESVQLTLPPNATATFSQALTAGAGLGKLKFEVSATSAGILESTLANNTASDTTDVSNPTVDFAITASGLSGTRSTGAGPGVLTLTVRNSTNVTEPAAFKDTATATARISELSHLTAQIQSCTTTNPGASCSVVGDEALVRLKPGQSANVVYSFTTPTIEGTARMTARVQADAQQSESNVGNNTALLSALVKDTPTLKRCMFPSQVNSEFLGCVSGLGPYGCQTSTAAVDWLTWHLTDGWVQTQGPLGTYWKKPDFSRGQATWKGTNQVVTPVLKTFGGNSYSYIVYPVAQVFERGIWSDHFLAGQGGGTVSSGIAGTTLVFWVDGPSPGGYYVDVPSIRGRAKVMPYNGVHSWYSASSPSTQYRSAGIDREGVSLRQTWEENSPGPNCAVPGTIKLVRTPGTGAWNPAP